MGAAYQLWDYRSEADYLTVERLGLEKHEYYQGQVTAMAGAQLAHNQIQGNCQGELRSRLRGKGCTAMGSDMRVHLPVHAFYTYPDVVVYCGKPQLLDRHADTLLNPTLLVEVLSPSTRTYDLGEKALRYHAIPSLQYYLIVDSARVYALLHTRGERAGEWLTREYLVVEDVISLPALAVELPLRDVYENVDFDTSALRVA